MPEFPHRITSIASVAVTIASLAACGRVTQPVTQPVVHADSGKVFALLDPGASTTTMQAYAALRSVDGLAYRVLWSGLEPSAGSYNWTSLDAAFAVVRQQGKKITIHVGPSDVGLPGWLGALGMARFGYTTPQGARSDPVPWDDVYVSNFRGFVAALGAHVRSTGNLDLVEALSDPVPVPEMTIVGCQNGQLTGGITYDRGKYLAAWQATLGAYASAFPGIRLFVSAPLGFICLNDGNDGQTFYGEVMRYASSVTNDAAVYAADLTALGSQRLQQASSLAGQPAIGLQTIWSYTSDPTNRMQGTLTSAVCHGWHAGARYFELYQSDLTSPDAGVQAAIGSARDGHGC